MVLHSVSISATAEENVNRLADITGGSKVHYADGGSSSAVFDAFDALANSAIDGKSASFLCFTQNLCIQYIYSCVFAKCNYRVLMRVCVCVCFRVFGR